MQRPIVHILRPHSSIRAAVVRSAGGAIPAAEHKNRTPAGAVCGYALFPFSGFAVEVGDIDQLHLADVVVAA